MLSHFYSSTSTNHTLLAATTMVIQGQQMNMQLVTHKRKISPSFNTIQKKAKLKIFQHKQLTDVQSHCVEVVTLEASGDMTQTCQ
mmetsp:Transcript_1718/g.2198  ORF Transcript_1718/g.2198 Transcript_1718/m.2198 type:complete len:85 (+) Transcript_1718:504-758(+)